MLQEEKKKSCVKQGSAIAFVIIKTRDSVDLKAASSEIQKGDLTSDLFSFFPPFFFHPAEDL